MGFNSGFKALMSPVPRPFHIVMPPSLKWVLCWI